MDRELIEKYKAELMAMSRRAAIRTVAEVENVTPTGKLVVSVTTYRGLKGVENAQVSVFTGDMNNRNVIDTDITDESGKTKEFVLATKSKNLSTAVNEDKTPYTTYNVYVRADGYVDEARLNIPVFEGVTSIQYIDLISFAANDDNETPRIIDEAIDYNL